ncbi:MAG: response regulator transcription factor [Lachnospiraceae bacterium]|nr:response regulator transcription factor [Lachnospiraceae bacterium]
MSYRILIAEDDERLREIVTDYFSSKNTEVCQAADGEEALEALREERFDAVLLDIMMPRLNGLAVLQAVRKNNDVPLIILTALSDEEDKLKGYELGADDYVTKPFSLSVLYAKTMALIRRNERKVLSSGQLIAGGITLDLLEKSVRISGQEIRLTPKEYALLLYLMQNKGQVLSREALLVHCWGYDYDGDERSVDTHIKRLREKLQDKASCIQTVIKSGYRFKEDIP